MNVTIPSEFGRMGGGIKVPSGAGNTLGAVPPRPVEEVRMPRRQCTECGSKCDYYSTLCRTCYNQKRKQHWPELTPPNPSGFCQCGCGQKTNLAPKDDYRPATLAVKGTPLRYIKGHQHRAGGIEYTVDDETGCWLWIGARNHAGYSTRGQDGRKVMAHRYMWERHNGPVPPGLILDHLCRNPACVNPEHLEPVTHTENVRRGKAAKLTVEQVREIRALADSCTRTELARRYDLTVSHVCHIIYRRSWRDVE